MTYKEFKLKHDEAHPIFCQDSFDVSAEVARRKAEAFKAYMAYMDTYHPRTRSTNPQVSAWSKFKIYIGAV